MKLQLVRNNPPSKFAVELENTILALDAQINNLSQKQNELLFCLREIAARPVVYMVKFDSDVCRITAGMATRLVRVSRLIRVKQYAIRKLKSKLRVNY